MGENRNRYIKKKDIAIIGIALRFPLSETKEQFWCNLRKGKDCIRKIPNARKEFVERYYHYIRKPFFMDMLREGAYLEHIDEFDYKFFNIPKKEAELMDPSQRLFLLTAMDAIEDSGYSFDNMRGSKTGVFLGCSGKNDYYDIIENLQPSLMSIGMTGNCSAITSGRVSYVLDLYGPNLIVNTSCSSSLVAVSLACNSLINDECEMAIAGGVQIYSIPIRNTKIGIESADGRCKPFDIEADGTGCGEGVGAILLKPFDKALQDKDDIYCIIKGWAINQDGKTIGISAPNPAAQTEVIKKALNNANIQAKDISYIEAHGTGTKLGDPVEIEGIKGAFQGVVGNEKCAVGSVKSNIGHLDGAAGIASIIKSALQLYYKELVPTAHFKKYNKNIDIFNSPLYVNNKLKYWKIKNKIRTCGVSSFGISGTNCHIIMQEMQSCTECNQKIEQYDCYHVLTLSAKTEEALEILIERYREFLTKNTYSIEDICFTSNIGRNHYQHRIGIIAKNRQELKEEICNLQFNTSHAENQLNMDKVNLLVKKFVDGGRKDYKLLKKIVFYYENGADINWELYYRGKDPKRRHLPLYPYKKSKCWVNIPDIKEARHEVDSFASVHQNSMEVSDYDIIEKNVREIFEAVLGDPDIGRQEDFYEMGGDSILAIDIVNRINKIYGIDSDVMDFLQNASIAEFSKLILLKMKQNHRKTFYQSIPKAEIKEYYCVSASQRRMYILNQIENTNTNYNITMAVKIIGKLDIKRFEKALDGLMDRHEILRTSFHVIDGIVMQKLHRKSDFQLDIVYSEEVDINQIITQCIKPFNLSQVPLFRAFLIKLHENNFLFVTDMHHIISDGESSRILINDLIKLYKGELLEEQKIQYKDFSEWQNRRILESESFKEQEKYWVEKYKDKIIYKGIATDFERFTVTNYEGETIYFDLGIEISEKLYRLAAKNNTTVFILLLSVLNVLLYKYSGEEVVVGTAVSNRLHEDLKNVAGMFVNTLAIKNKVEKDMAFSELLQQVKNVTLEGYRNQEYPFDLLIEKLDIEYSSNRNPLFDVMFVMQNNIREDIKIENVTFEFVDISDKTCKVDLLINCHEKKGNLLFDFNYCTEIYERETIRHLWLDYLDIVEQIIMNPETCIGDISIGAYMKAPQFKHLDADFDFS